MNIEVAQAPTPQAPASHRRGKLQMSLAAFLALAAAIKSGRPHGVLLDEVSRSRNCPRLAHRRKKFKGWQRELRRKNKRKVGGASGRRK